MISKNQYNCFGNYISRLISVKAHKLIGVAGFTELDKEDIEQELILDVIKRLKYYNPAIAKKETFIRHIVDNRIVSLIHERTSKSKDFRNCQKSLNDSIGSIEDDDDCEMLENTTYEGFIRYWSGETLENESIDQMIDIERLVEKLPPDLRVLYDNLLFKPIIEIAQEVGVHRTTLYKRLKKLRKWFARYHARTAKLDGFVNRYNSMNPNHLHGNRKRKFNSDSTD